MLKTIKNYLFTFYQLIKTDWIVIKCNFVGNVIDSTVWITGLTIVFAYIFPLLGMPKTFGAFHSVGWEFLD